LRNTAPNSIVKRRESGKIDLLAQSVSHSIDFDSDDDIREEAQDSDEVGPSPSQRSYTA
jgi:hypothetical protein